MAPASRLVVAIAVVACWPPATATADLLITPFLGLKFGGATSFVDLDRGADNTKLTLGGALTLLDEGVLGLELDLGLTPRFFDPGTGGLTASGSVRTLTGNVLVLTPRSVTRESLRPYLVAGAGWMNVNIDDVQEIEDTGGGFRNALRAPSPAGISVQFLHGFEARRKPRSSVNNCKN
ncbi:MAG: porin family protein [Acidobacteria bacterium]|nr:porin family protein [Acidobacteriota bacterium]